MKPANYEAVSPVIGVMLMLVVTIIIAAVVAAFASGSMANTAKTPSATLKGVYSQSSGMQIVHAGGDVIPMSNLLVTVSNDASFGQSSLGMQTVQVVDKSLITDVNGKQVVGSDGSMQVTSFGPGQTLVINKTNIACGVLQPQIVPNNPGPVLGNDGIWRYFGSKTGYWALCFVNSDNVGKTFTLAMSDKSSGSVLAKTTVLISP